MTLEVGFRCVTVIRPLPGLSQVLLFYLSFPIWASVSQLQNWPKAGAEMESKCMLFG